MPSILVTVGSYFWELLKVWGQLFIAPIQNFQMLWVIIPVYLNWIISELFQEKKGTSTGNAISNAAIVLWASVDWARTSLNFFSGKIISSWKLTMNIIASLAIFLYGAFIVYEGIKGKSITHYIGRIRILSYIVLMITPLIYNAKIPLGKAVIAMIVFFPIFYYLIELIDYLLPDPVSVREEGEKVTNIGSGDFGTDSNANNLQDFKNFKL